VPGFYITDSHSVTPNYGVRGFSIPDHINTRILFLMNGLPVADKYWSGFMTQLIPDMMDAIDHIEVITGPGSALYGDNAIEGVVNIVTRKGADLRGAQVSGEAGSNPSGRGVFTYGDKLTNGLDIFLSGHYEDDDGQTLSLPPYGNVKNVDSHTMESLFLSGSYEELSLRLWYAHDNRIIPTGPFGAVVGDNDNRSIHWQYLGDLQWQHEIDDTKQLSWRVYGQAATTEANLAYDMGTPFMLNQWHGDRWGGTELQFNWQPIERNLLILGSVFEYHWTYLRGNDTDPSGTTLDTEPGGEHDFPYWAAYAQDDFRLCDNLTFTAGLRFDYLSETGDENLSPRAALVWNVTPQTTAKLLYGRAFRAPNQSQRTFPADSGFGPPNSDINSEGISTYEAVLEQDFKHGLSGRVSAFHNDLHDLIGEVSAAPLIYGNVLDIHTTGIEGELNQQFAHGVRGFINGTWQNSDFEPGPAVDSPHWIANFGIVYPILGDRLSLGVRENYISSRETFVPGQQTGNSYLTDLTLSSCEWLRHWTFNLSVKNLLDQRDLVPGNPGDLLSEMPDLGRTILFRATYRF
jgi:iron complex outermembrane receptor protein